MFVYEWCAFELVLLFREGFRTVKIVFTCFTEEYSRKHVAQYNFNVNHSFRLQHPLFL